MFDCGLVSNNSNHCHEEQDQFKLIEKYHRVVEIHARAAAQTALGSLLTGASCLRLGISLQIVDVLVQVY